MNNIIFDISTKESALNFLMSIYSFNNELDLKKLIAMSDRDHSIFWDKAKSCLRQSIDIKTIKCKVFHITSNDNECKEIRQNGIVNLQKALSENTQLKKIFDENKIFFDIKGKLLLINDKKFNLNFNVKSYELDLNQKPLWRIAHRIYSDYQTDAFFSYKDSKGYGGEIHRKPEFIETFCNCFSEFKNIPDKWIKSSKGYVIECIVPITHLAIYTFDIEENNGITYREFFKRLTKMAFYRCIGYAEEEIAYFKNNESIMPTEIIEYHKIV